MGMIIAVVVGVLLALLYSRSGLFAAAVALVSVFLAALTALGLGVSVVHAVGMESPHALGAAMAAVGVFSFMVIRGLLMFVNPDVDFHPLIERLGGGLVGLATGLVAVGFVCVCVLCTPYAKKLGTNQGGTEQAAALVLEPSRRVTELLHLNGAQPLSVGRLLAVAGPRFSPSVPPPPQPEHSAEPESIEALGPSESDGG